MIPQEQRKSMIDKENDSPSLSRQCRLLSIHLSGIYYRARSESENNLGIMRFLDEQYFQTLVWRSLQMPLSTQGNLLLP